MRKLTPAEIAKIKRNRVARGAQRSNGSRRIPGGPGYSSKPVTKIKLKCLEEKPIA